MTVYLLSLAGGGIRGAITVSFLEQLEKFLILHNGNNLHDQFQMYTGSSTGALIASGIAHEKLTATTLMNEFYTPKKAKKIMNYSWMDYIFGVVQTRPKYNGVGKREVIDSIVGDKLISETEKDVLIPIYNITDEEPVFARSWDKETDYNLANILDATSAAPGFFPSVEFVKDKWAIDGSIVSHNPAMSLYIEALEKYPDEEIVIISVGTGQGYPQKIGEQSSSWGGIEWATKGKLADLLLDAPMEGDEEYTKKLVEQNGHKYININGNLHNTKMDDISAKNIKKLKEIGKDLWDQNSEKLTELFGTSKLFQIMEEEKVFF